MQSNHGDIILRKFGDKDAVWQLENLKTGSRQYFSQQEYADLLECVADLEREHE